ncbi:hypothetical protein BDW22DRAFT_1433260 [Trametopsis cervina]|nr:hypothetical protein BDW22DRAFT_1433260 [Trametopsis cervina]
MLNRSLPYFLEDRTGLVAHSDYDDIYDRLFLSVSSPSLPCGHAPSHPQSQPTTLTIHNTGRRSSSSHHPNGPPRLHRSSSEPAITLEFGARGALGNVILPAHAGSEGPVPMGQWLRKTSLFSSSLSRKFRASDGAEYRWIHRGAEGQEWTLVDGREYLVAHYALRPADKPAYSTSGNVLTVYESHVHIVVEILASLTIMRHIEANNL